MDISNKTAVLTGAARGIGRALSVELAREGCGLLLIDVKVDELDTLNQELRKYPVNVSTMGLDLTDFEQRCELIDRIRAAEPPVDIVIGSRPSDMGMTHTP